MERQQDGRERAEVFEQERRLMQVIEEYMLDDKDWLLSEFPTFEDRLTVVNQALMEMGLDEDAMLMEAGLITDVNYGNQAMGGML